MSLKLDALKEQTTATLRLLFQQCREEGIDYVSLTDGIIGDLWEEIEREDPEYQKTLLSMVNDTLQSLERCKEVKPEDSKQWLSDLSKQALEEDKDENIAAGLSIINMFKKLDNWFRPQPTLPKLPTSSDQVIEVKDTEQVFNFKPKPEEYERILQIGRQLYLTVPGLAKVMPELVKYLAFDPTDYSLAVSASCYIDLLFDSCSNNRVYSVNYDEITKCVVLTDRETNKKTFIERVLIEF